MPQTDTAEVSSRSLSQATGYADVLSSVSPNICMWIMVLFCEHFLQDPHLHTISSYLSISQNK
jgi:hypothetical protein